MLEKQTLDGGRGEWHLAREHLKEYNAHSIDIGTRIDRLFVDLLRCHIFGGSNHLINIGEREIIAYVAGNTP